MGELTTQLHIKTGAPAKASVAKSTTGLPQLKKAQPAKPFDDSNERTMVASLPKEEDDWTALVDELDK